MRKLIVPVALALAVMASGAAFAKTHHSNLNANSTRATAQSAIAGRSGMMKSQDGTKIVWKKHHYSVQSQNGLFGPYGPE